MCGIVGYVGKKQATPILLNGLFKLEYRGYDSAGIAVQNKKNSVKIVKTKGRICVLAQKIQGSEHIEGTCGIAHTRWATHGEPSEINAHPHYSANNVVTLVHNGILENYAELKEQLRQQGYAFYSQTDTEVIANLLDYYLKQHKNCPIGAFTACLKRARGSYALAVLFQDYPDEIYVARKESPLVIGVGEGEMFLASDVSAILNHTQNVYFMEDLEFARLTADGVSFYNAQGARVERQITQIAWSAQAMEKGGYRHFMRKEIHEQPQAVEKTLQCLLEKGKGNLFKDEEMRNFKQIYVVACGSAYHAGVVAQYAIESLAKIPVRVELASEFRYREPLLTRETLVLIISQSGETADSLAALREAKKLGARTLAIVNVVGSSIAREADRVLYTQAGPEIAVATTKAYSAQLIVGYWLALEFAKLRKEISEDEHAKLLVELRAIPQKIGQILQEEGQLEEIAKRLACSKDIFFIGRGVDYAVSLEGSLKMKEISYIHSEAYAAGELKHGTLSLIEEGVWTVSVATQMRLYEKTCSNMQEIKSRGGKILAITSAENEGVADIVLRIPKTEACFSASIAVIPLQFLAYYVSVQRGLDVDKPRNLAKSVTVE